MSKQQDYKDLIHTPKACRACEASYGLKNQSVVGDGAKIYTDKTFMEQLNSTDPSLRELYYAVRDYVLALGDDVTEYQLKLYVAYKKIKNIDVH
jgi:hypothetical protein